MVAASRSRGSSTQGATIDEAIARIMGTARCMTEQPFVSIYEVVARAGGVTKLHLHRAGLVTPAKTRSAHRKKRPRRPMVGMMLHQDASTHAWLPGDAGKQDLVVTMEDATSELYSAFLVDEEGTASSLRGIREVVAKHGLFCSLYTDRGSHYFETPEAGARVSKTVLTQFGRALKQLGIEHIAAYSPQARGRSERVFGTLQDRLPKEFALAGITTVEAANRWLRDVYIAEHNKRFSIDAEQEGSAFVVDGTGAWREILCIQEERTVGNDNTVKWHRLSLQLPASRLRPHFVKAKVRVHEYPDGQLAVLWGRIDWPTTTPTARSFSRSDWPHDTLPAAALCRGMPRHRARRSGHALAHKDTLYRCLDKLLVHKADLFSFLQQRWKSLFGAGFEVLLYDLTSTYFECDPPEAGKRRFGYRRDKRSDCVQVVIALVVTPDGLPLAYEVMAGNISDKTTLRDFIERIEAQYGKARRTWVMDRGIPTEAILAEMRASETDTISGGHAARTPRATGAGFSEQSLGCT